MEKDEKIRLLESLLTKKDIEIERLKEENKILKSGRTMGNYDHEFQNRFKDFDNTLNKIDSIQRLYQEQYEKYEKLKKKYKKQSKEALEMMK